MLTIKELSHYPIFQDLNDKELELVLPMCSHVHVDEQKRIYKEGERAETFFLVQSGTVLLEQRISKKMVVTVGSLKAGGSFGLAAILGHESYSMDAVAANPCELIMIHGPSLMDLFSQNTSIGYKITKATVLILQERLVQRTQQFVRSIASHPDIHGLEED